MAEQDSLIELGAPGATTGSSASKAVPEDDFAYRKSVFGPTETVEPDPPNFCVISFLFLASIAFGVIVVLQTGQGWSELFRAAIWSLANFNWALWLFQYNAIEIYMKRLGKAIQNSNWNPEYADAHIKYDIKDSMKQRKFLYLNLLTMGTLGFIALMQNSRSQWQKNVLAKPFELTDFETTGVVDTEKHSMSYVITHPRYSCKLVGITPMPYTYLLAKLTLTGFFQDLVLGSDDLVEAQSAPLDRVTVLFAAYQIGTCLLSPVLFYVRHTFSGSYWSIYQTMCYLTFMGSGYTNSILLLCKMFIETNINARLKCPHSFDRLERYRFPPLPRCGIIDKACVFWVILLTTLVYALPLLFTHVIAAILYSLCAVTFPFWGIACLAMSFFKSSSLYDVARWSLVVGSRAHEQFWGIIGLLTLMVHVAMLVREQLWRIQCWFAGERVDGKYGYIKGAMSMFFGVPLVFLTQSLPIWSNLAYGGWDLGDLPFTDYNARVVRDYNSCFLSGTVEDIVVNCLYLV